VSSIEGQDEPEEQGVQAECQENRDQESIAVRLRSMTSRASNTELRLWSQADMHDPKEVGLRGHRRR
jgi:hypothetical protein